LIKIIRSSIKIDNYFFKKFTKGRSLAVFNCSICFQKRKIIHIVY